MAIPGRAASGHGMKYSLTPHGSSTKLSSLAEETERTTDKRSGSRSSSSAANKGRTPPIKVENDNRPSPSITGDFITHSCLLNSDDDNEIDNEGVAEDEDNFPLSLSLTSSVDSTSDQITMAMRTDPLHGIARYKVQSPENIDARYKVRSPEGRPMSARDAKHGGTATAVKGGKRLQRAASFSQQRSHRLTNELADIRQRACSLSAHGDPLDPNFTTVITGAGPPDLEVSPSSGIVAFKLPFVFSSAHSGSQELASPSLPGGRDSPKFLSGSPLRPSGEGPPLAWWEVESSSSSSCLFALQRSYVLGRELLSMAKARQGPIMLLSTELVCLFTVSLGSSTGPNQYIKCTTIILCCSVLPFKSGNLKLFCKTR